MKQTIFSISGALGVNRLFAAWTRHQPIVLTFHGVTSDRSRPLCNHEGLHLESDLFERLMTHVAREYQPVPLSDIAAWLRGEGAAPDRAVAVTFDDGYHNVLTDAAPVLQRLGIPATLFVVTDFVFDGKMLWTDRLVATLALTRESALALPGLSSPLSLRDDAERIAADRALLALLKPLPEADRLARLQEIQSALKVADSQLPAAWAGMRPLAPADLARLPGFGIEVGAHTCSHPIATRLTPERLRHELVESKSRIEAATGRACTAFAYPNGGPDDFNAETRRAVHDAGYTCAVTTIKRRVTHGDDALEIPRCTLTHNDVTLAEFAAEVSGLPGVLRSARRKLVPAGSARPAPGGY